MAQEIIKAENFFDRRFGVTGRDLEKLLSQALERKADYADLYFEYRVNEGVSLEEGLVKHGSRSTSNGVGVRVLSETKTGYAYTDDITTNTLAVAARTAQAIAQHGSAEVPVKVGHARAEAHDLYPVPTPATEVALEKKTALLYEIDQLARSLDPRVKNVLVSFASEEKIVLVASSKGLVVGDIQPLARLNITCIAEQGGNRQVGV